MYLVLMVSILGALFTLIGGAYVFNWITFMEMRKVTRDLYQKIDDVKTNDLNHLSERVKALEKDA